MKRNCISYPFYCRLINLSLTVSRIKYPNAICITATGWINAPYIKCKNQRSYIVAYSLHSNFKEIESFVRSVQPAKITPIERVRTTNTKLEELVDQGAFALRKMKQKGLDKLIESYTNIDTQSKEYRNLLVIASELIRFINFWCKGPRQLEQCHARARIRYTEQQKQSK